MQAAPYILDPGDPRAPSQEVWDQLTPQQRQEVLDTLPSEFPRALPAEGDPHRHAKERAFQVLDEYFRRLQREVYLSSELPVYYPDERMFAPDVIAVLDVPTHERNGWVVSQEGKGLDFVLEIHVAGNWHKDFELNVERFARLGIPEYFAFDHERSRLLGWRLGSGPAYTPIIPQEGRWSSEILGLDLALDYTLGHGRLTFLHGSAELLDGRALVGKLSAMVDDAVQRAEQEARRAEEQTRRADRLAARLRELGIDPDVEP